MRHRRAAAAGGRLDRAGPSGWGGADPGWAVAHGLLFAAIVLLIPASLAFRHLLRERVGEGWRELGPALVVVGALATAGNFTVDLVAW
jgi:hypothetical protein